MTVLTVATSSRMDLIDITDQVRQAVRRSGVQSGLCVLHVPHTTAAVTVNENSDPDVVRDIIVKYNRMVPVTDGYHHNEGNSDAHVKSSLTGCSTTLIIDNGDLALGVWQAIYFCEFDGPRTRNAYVQCVSA